MSRILISGASIAGPALASWLHRSGHDVTVVEKNDGIRPGGQAVDFKGTTHMKVLREMGILDEHRRYDIRDGNAAIVDEHGRTIGVAPGGLGSGELNVPRDTIATVLYERTKHDVHYRFADRITDLVDDGDGVTVTFRSGGTDRFDLVVGADGVHSGVRRLVWGPEEQFVEHRGHHYVLADLDLGDDDVVYSQPGMTVMLGGSKAPTFIVVAADRFPEARDDVDEQKRQVAGALRGGRWRIPEIVDRFPDARSFYTDSISRVTVEQWSRGRVVLLGDSAWGNALSGYGTGLALVGAYALAGELRLTDGDVTTALREWEQRFRPYTAASHKVNAGALLAPTTERGIRLRKLFFRAASVASPLVRLLDLPAKGLDLRRYEHAGALPRGRAVQGGR